MKFVVMKNEDVLNHLSAEQRGNLLDIIDSIVKGREKEGKNAFNQYIVINTDEPYKDSVVEIMKANGHWGPSKPKTSCACREAGCPHVSIFD